MKNLYFHLNLDFPPESKQVPTINLLIHQDNLNTKVKNLNNPHNYLFKKIKKIN